MSEFLAGGAAMSIEVVLFYCFAGLALFSALAMLLFVRNAMAGAMSLLLSMVSLAGIFVLLGAEFLGVVQIIVYAGAIMVLLLFMLMLSNLDEDEFGPSPSLQRIWKTVACAVALAVALLLGWQLPGVLPEIAEGAGLSIVSEAPAAPGRRPRPTRCLWAPPWVGLSKLASYSLRDSFCRSRSWVCCCWPPSSVR